MSSERLADLVARVRLDTRELDDAPQKARKVGAGMSAGLTKGLLVAGGAAAVGSFFKGAIDAASDMAESTSKATVVFGESTKQITEFAESAATAVGLSKQAALEATGTLGNLFVALKMPQAEAAKMSEATVRLAADLASFNNTSVDDALNALRSGLIGESEPLKRFGVNLNEATVKEKALSLGLVKTAKEVLPASAKAQAVYALILEQTATAQGDFARTSDGLANQTRIAQARFADVRAELGQRLLPILLDVTEGASKLLGVIADNPKIFDAAIGFGKIALALVAINKAVKISRAIRASELVTTLAQVRASQTLLATETARASLPGGGVAGGRNIAGKAGALAAVGVVTYAAGDYVRDKYVGHAEDERRYNDSGDAADRARIAMSSAKKFRGNAGFEAAYQERARPLIQKGDYDAAAKAIAALTHEYALLTPAQRAAAHAQGTLNLEMRNGVIVSKETVKAVKEAAAARQASFDAFGEQAKRKPLAFSDVVGRIKVNTSDVKQLALDIEDLLQGGVSLPVVRKMQELESSFPGTIRGIVASGIDKEFVGVINQQLGEADYANAIVASLLESGSRAAVQSYQIAKTVTAPVIAALDTELRRYRGGIPPIVIDVDTRSAMAKLADLKREVRLVSRLGDDPDVRPGGRTAPRAPSTPTPGDVGRRGGQLVNSGGAGFTP